MGQNEFALLLVVVLLVVGTLDGFAFTATAAAASRTPALTRSSRLSSTATTATSTAAAATASSYLTVPVDLGDRSYPIYIGERILDTEEAMLASYVHGSSVLVVSNEVVAPLYMAKTVAALRKGNPSLKVHELVLPDGEQTKCLDVMNLILDKAMAERLDRKTTFVALGGGVIGDMVGFASAVYQRGVNFIQVPTTVMAMVDSSVGGKTGVNHPAGKNMIGAFHQPQCVFIDSATLKSLPDRELKSGISEIIKYGLIRDAEFFVWLEENIPALLNRDAAVFAQAIKRSCENKAAVVAADEKEAGLRATLNLGHTFGHAVETGSGYGTFLHGEAVAIGTAMAAQFSAKMGWIDDVLLRRIYDIMKLADLPIALPKNHVMTPEIFRDLMSADKKVANGVLRLILLKGNLGNCEFTSEYDEKKMDEVIVEFCNHSEVVPSV
jgi:3-dehydroquinate synthase